MPDSVKNQRPPNHYPAIWWIEDDNSIDESKEYSSSNESTHVSDFQDINKQNVTEVGEQAEVLRGCEGTSQSQE